MKSLMFVLPVGGGGGGAHSVMQEAEAMCRLGVRASVAVNMGNLSRIKKIYRDLPRVSENIHGFIGPDGLKQLIEVQKPDVVIGTTNQSVHTVANAVRGNSEVRTGYYVQDYEPLFYAPESDEWQLAYSSFGLVPGMVHFAKTKWLQDIVSMNHKVSVAKVVPSIDHSIYYPDLGTWTGEEHKLTIAAMVRPPTPRRAPRRTARILNRLATEMGENVRLVCFGSSEYELKTENLHIDSRVENLSVLRRDEVGDLMRSVDLFLDLSDYQAFGRTAIEAMSCGAISVIPIFGGGYEYAVNGQNCYVVDTRFDELILDAVRTFASIGDARRQTMKAAAVQAGLGFTPERAALSELMLFFG